LTLFFFLSFPLGLPGLLDIFSSSYEEKIFKTIVLLVLVVVLNNVPLWTTTIVKGFSNKNVNVLILRALILPPKSDLEITRV
jgi:hypothetical protein